MNITKRTLTRTAALAGGGALLAVPVVFLVPGAANADVERNGACGGGRYELNVDRESGRFEVSVELDQVAAGSRWRIVMKQDGKRFFADTRRADGEGDLDVERLRRDTAGRDTFSFRASRLDGAASCSAALSVR